MDKDFLEPPKRMMKEYLQHGLLLILDVVFMLFWVGMQALYHIGSEWIIDKAGFGVVDQAVKLCFDIAFAGTTFIWVVRTVWRVHSEAYAHGGKPTRRHGGGGGGS